MGDRTKIGEINGTKAKENQTNGTAFTKPN